jgi:hypothetical protein
MKLALRILPSKKLGDRIDLTKVLFTGILKANINSFIPILLLWTLDLEYKAN